MTGSHDGTIRLWDGEDGEELVCIPAAHGTRTTTATQDDGNKDGRNDNDGSGQRRWGGNGGGGVGSSRFVRTLALTAAQTRTDAKDFSRVSASSYSSEPVGE